MQESADRSAGNGAFRPLRRHRPGHEQPGQRCVLQPVAASGPRGGPELLGGDRPALFGRNPRKLGQRWRLAPGRIAAMRYLCSVLASLFAATLLACGAGGGDPSEPRYDDLVAQAAAKESEARALAVSSPCTQASQCAALAFLAPTGICPVQSLVAYSLVASSASAASAAATEQVRLAAEARAMRPTTPAPCPIPLPGTPGLACASNTCSLAP